MSWQQTREDTLDRDDYECQFCGMTNDEHEVEHGRGLNAHHILKDREGGRDHPENLITVCEDCHNTLEQTHAKAIAELKRATEPDETAETKLGRLSRVWQSRMQLTDELNNRLAQYVDQNPITARELGAYTESGPDVNVNELRGKGRVYEGSVGSEFRFAAMWGYKQAYQDLLYELEETDPQLRHRDTPRDRVKNIKSIISRIESENLDGAPISEILEQAEQNGFERSQAEHEIEKLRRQGDVYEPTDGHLRTV